MSSAQLTNSPMNSINGDIFQSDHDPAAQRRAAARNAIVGKYFDLLTKVQQDLAMRRDTSLRQRETTRIEGMCTQLSQYINGVIY